MQHERRMYPRVKRSLKLDMHRKRLGILRGPRNIAELVDVSRSGARVNTRSELQNGDRLVLVLKTKTMRSTLEFNAQVVWTRQVSTDLGKFLQAGIRFKSVSAEQSSVLFRFAVEAIQDSK